MGARESLAALLTAARVRNRQLLHLWPTYTATLGVFFSNKSDHIVRRPNRFRMITLALSVSNLVVLKAIRHITRFRRQGCFVEAKSLGSRQTRNYVF